MRRYWVEAAVRTSCELDLGRRPRVEVNGDPSRRNGRERLVGDGMTIDPGNRPAATVGGAIGLLSRSSGSGHPDDAAVFVEINDRAGNSDVRVILERRRRRVMAPELEHQHGHQHKSKH